MEGPDQTIEGFIDIEIRRPRLRSAIMVLFFVFCLYSVTGILIVVSALRSQTKAASVIAIFLMVFSIALVLHLLRRLKRLRARRRQAASDGPEQCARFLRDHQSRENGTILLRGLLKDLVSLEKMDTTIRMHWPNAGCAISPIVKPFSPLLLDESDPTFAQMEVAIQHESGVSGPSNSGAFQAEELVIPGIIRNFRIKGGVLTVVFLSIAAGFSLVDSVVSGQDLSAAIFWLAILAIYLLVRRGTGPFSKIQWLIIPGGLIFRRPCKGNARQSSLYFFNRRRCALGLIQTHKSTWFLCVRDTNTHGSTILTSREAAMFLRAWLSPLEPPPVEKLVDLT